MENEMARPGEAKAVRREKKNVAGAEADGILTVVGVGWWYKCERGARYCYLDNLGYDACTCRRACRAWQDAAVPSTQQVSEMREAFHARHTRT
jgi:hypothetical protein